MVGCLVEWLDGNGWLIGRSVSRSVLLVGWLVGWLADWLVGADRLVGWLVYGWLPAEW